MRSIKHRRNLREGIKFSVAFTISCGQDGEPEAMPSHQVRATIRTVFYFYSMNTSAGGKTSLKKAKRKNSKLCKGSILAVLTEPTNTQLKKGSIIEDMN